LREPQQNAGITAPQTYEDDDLILQSRSALRHLKARGVAIPSVMDTDGTLTPELDDTVGVLVALRVAAMLLRGDMVKRVMTGEMGFVFQMGSDTIDTKTAAIQFGQAASKYEDEFTTLLTIALTADDVSASVLGDGKAPSGSKLSG
jgi:hypothetical protein